MSDWIKEPWPWYVAGPLIGLMVPLLLILGNKSFGISSSLRHICAACLPANIPFFQYHWKKEIWNLIFIFGVFLGAIIATQFLSNHKPLDIHEDLIIELKEYGVQPNDLKNQIPVSIFNWNTLLSIQGFVLFILGGFLIGFGTRYAGGCTSGHSIMGLSTLQLPSLIATICFMIGGFISANYLLPLIFKL